MGLIHESGDPPFLLPPPPHPTCCYGWLCDKSMIQWTGSKSTKISVNALWLYQYQLFCNNLGCIIFMSFSVCIERKRVRLTVMFLLWASFLCFLLKISFVICIILNGWLYMYSSKMPLLLCWWICAVAFLFICFGSPPSLLLVYIPYIFEKSDHTFSDHGFKTSVFVVVIGPLVCRMFGDNNKPNTNNLD